MQEGAQMKARVYVTLKKGVLDPQGKAIKGSLRKLGYDNVEDVRLGKFIELEIEGDSREKAGKSIEEMSKRLLANTVIEDFRYEIE
jgi:phosphoribosylformylglycinamidine synthase